MDRIIATDRLDPKALLERYHARHGVRHLTCPLCMRPMVRIPSVPAARPASA